MDGERDKRRFGEGDVKWRRERRGGESARGRDKGMDGQRES
jgi:hypothetical protein